MVRRAGVLFVLAAAVAAAETGPEAVGTLRQQGSYESLRAVYEAARYRAESAGPGAYRAVNRAQGLEVEFSPDGVRLRHRQGELRMRLELPGRAAMSGIIAGGNRVEYRHAGLREWYVNEAAGLEQGFTIEQRPAGGGPLVLALETSGDLRPVAANGGVEFRAGGETVLCYGGLKSWDARGRAIPSRLKVAGRQIRIAVEDGAAEYPLVVDPVFTEQQKLTASDGAAGDKFGVSVAVNGDTVIVGASGATVGSASNQGSAYVFVRTGTTWTEQANLIAADGAANQYFGQSVAVEGDTGGGRHR